MTYADYPDAAKSNARRALKHKRENGSQCGTRVGWFRAVQISSGEGLTEDEVRRTYSFLSRAEVYDQNKYTDEKGNEICGSVMYDAWGGSAMKTWAEAKFNEIEEKKLDKEENKLMAKYKIEILGEISEGSNSFNSFKTKMEEARGQDIELFINSGGGSITEGIAMADLISTYPNSVTTTGIGLVGSIATVVLLAGNKVQMTENSFMMIHRPWSYSIGNSEELEATAELLDKMEEKLLDIYVKSVSKRKGEEKNLKKKISKMMAAETWMTAEEAKEFGFIDEIVQSGEKKIDVLPLQTSLNKFQNVPAALLINNTNDEMGNSILEKIKTLLNSTETEVVEQTVEPVVEVEQVDEVQVAINTLNEKGYTVLTAEEMAALTEKTNEQTSSIAEIETVLETLSAELVALRAQVKKGVGLPSGGSANEKVIETKAKSSPFDSFANLVKNKISLR